MNPDTFNDDMHVVVFDNGVHPDTFNYDVHVQVVVFDNVVMPDNVVVPDTFNDDTNVVLCVVLVYIAPLKTAGNLIDPFVDVQSNLPVGFKEITEFDEFCIKLALSPMNKQRELSLLMPNNNAPDTLNDDTMMVISSIHL